MDGLTRDGPATSALVPNVTGTAAPGAPVTGTATAGVAAGGQAGSSSPAGPFDLIVESIGGEALGRALRLVARGGTVVTLGNSS